MPRITPCRGSSEQFQQILKCAYLRPKVEFCKNSKSPDHQFDIGQPQKKDPGHLNLRGPSYGHSKRATVIGISSNLMKIAHLCSNTHFSGLEWSFGKIQKPRTIRMKCPCSEQAPRTVAPLEGELQPERVGNLHKIFTNFVQRTISLATNGLFWKFKNLKSLVWSA